MLAVGRQQGNRHDDNPSIGVGSGVQGFQWFRRLIPGEALDDAAAHD